MYHFLMHQIIAKEPEEEHPSQSLRGDAQHLIRQELDSILRHPLFARSKRYPKFLSFIVEKSLANDFASLKERVIGIELLGKPGDYDNSADPEVRNIASEVRKRLIQYYQQTSGQQVRIELPAGSYIPVFHGPAQAQADASSTEEIPSPSNTENVEPSNADKSLRFLSRHRGLLVAAAALLLLIGAIATIRVWRNSRNASTLNVLDHFWTPLFHSGSPVVLVIGTRGNPQISPDQNNRLTNPALSGPPTVSVDSASALSRITAFLGTKGESYEIHTAHETQYASLRGRPSVLIGGLNNGWGLRLLGNARYRMAYDSKAAQTSITDTKTGRRWIGPAFGATDSREHMDYAIVSRQKDAMTGGSVIIVAGLGSAGTVAAAEFVTNATYLHQISNANMEQNQEFVLATDVIDTVPGPPHIIAMHSW